MAGDDDVTLLTEEQRYAKWKKYESFKSDNPDEIAQFFIDPPPEAIVHKLS